MKIRKFWKEDAEACSKLILSCINKSRNLTKKAKENLKLRSTPDALIKKAKQRDYYIYEKKKKILGMGALSKDEIKTMYTLPRFQNKGIGSLILKELEKIAKKNKIKKLFLYTHPKASKFYLKNKYSLLKQYKDKNNSMKVIVMEKKL